MRDGYEDDRLNRVRGAKRNFQLPDVDQGDSRAHRLRSSIARIEMQRRLDLRAMVYDGTSSKLELQEVADPRPDRNQVLLRVEACGVCRTDLHVVDGQLTDPKQPLIPGHEIVGRIAELGPGVSGFSLGQRVGVPWLGNTCGA
ncbi:MAG: alcohol dehydrogenase catalytic domain-containing protein, partial [Nioella sp.]